MAQFDLKKAHIYIRDGYAGLAGAASAAVNNVSGYASGAVTMTIDGVVGVVPTGDIFTVAGDSRRHRVTSHTETTGNTSSITFTPALGGAVVDNAVITWMPHELEIKVGEGTLHWTEKRNIVYVKDRGLLGTVREGDQDPVEAKLDFIWEFLRSSSGGTIPTPEEAIKQLGPASTWVSSSSDPCEPYAVNLEIEYFPPCVQDSEHMILHDFRWESLEHDGKNGTLQVSGKCNITNPSVSRVTVP
jgi:hypothetical protein